MEPTSPPPAAPGAPAAAVPPPPLRPHRSAQVLRWAIVLVVLVAGVALLATGHLFGGVLLTVLAGLRIALLVTVGHRRAEVRSRLEARRAQRWAGAPGAWNGPGPRAGA